MSGSNVGCELDRTQHLHCTWTGIESLLIASPNPRSVHWRVAVALARGERQHGRLRELVAPALLQLLGRAERRAPLRALRVRVVEQVDDALLTRSNLWIFAPESDLKASLTAYEGWVKDNGLKETQGIKGGLFEGEVLDAKKVAAIKDLPTLPELMTRLAVGINMAGAQGIAKSINLAKGGPRGIAIRLKKVVDEEKL